MNGRLRVVVGRILVCPVVKGEIKTVANAFYDQFIGGSIVIKGLGMELMMWQRVWWRWKNDFTTSGNNMVSILTSVGKKGFSVVEKWIYPLWKKVWTLFFCCGKICAIFFPGGKPFND